MSDLNIGARKEMNIRNHLFIVYGVINNANNNGEDECLSLQIYDIVKAFDSLWVENCMNDLLDTIEDDRHDDKVATLYKLNETNMIKVKTPMGESEEFITNNIVQQGGNWGPVLCSNSVDKIGKNCVNNNKYCYIYKNAVKIPPLGMMDDLLCISKCGIESVELNAYMNTNKISYA